MQVTVNDVEKDTIYNLVRSYMAVTPEVITNNNIDLTISPEIRGMINSGDNILIAPAGTEVELTFPLADILASYRRGASKLSTSASRYRPKRSPTTTISKYRSMCSWC